MDTLFMLVHEPNGEWSINMWRNGKVVAKKRHFQNRDEASAGVHSFAFQRGCVNYEVDVSAS